PSVIAFAKRWHKAGAVDRGLTFMITSGRSEFAEYVWALIGGTDGQLRIRALRAAYRFRATVLGSDAQERIKALPSAPRREVLSGLAFEGGPDTLELVEKFVKEEPDTEIQSSVLSALEFRGADRAAREILEKASDETWELVVRRRGELAQKGWPTK